MSEQKEKVIIVSNKVNEKIADELRLRLEAQGIKVKVKDKESMTKEEVQEIDVVFKCKEPTLSEINDEVVRMVAENVKIFEDPIKYNNKKTKKYVPKKIGEESKAKVQNVRGKRYGR